MQNARAEADGLARQTVRSLEATLESVQVSGRTLAASATGVGAQPANLRSLLVASLAGDPDIAGAMIIVEPGLLPGDADGFTWYIRRDGARLVEQSVADLGYDYKVMPWYQRTISARAPQVEGQRGEQQQPGVDHAGPQHHPRAQAVAPAHAAGGHHVRVRRDQVGTASLRDGHAVARGGVAPILPTSAAMVPCTTRAVPGTVPDTVSIATETASRAATYAPTYAPVARRAQGALR